MNDLNPMQEKAVGHGDGPLLVLAGAGSGKTRVLVSRVANLILQRKISPEQVLLVTFTNKAAGEMKERLNDYEGLGNRLPWAGTFHSFGARVLREDGEKIGISKNYVIYDETDRLDAVKMAMEKSGISPKEVKPAAVTWAISGAKNELLSPIEYAGFARGFFQDAVARTYLEYQKILREYDALDFDDLIFETVRLWQKDVNSWEKYREQYRYVLVDEYQDTNRAQYQLTKMLASKWRNLTVVGDASQAIYGWRGANYRNLINLKSDYPDLTTINLEQNYRSSQIILNAATAVISQNKSHPILKLWTEKDAGDKLEVFESRSELDEAKFVIEKVKESLGSYSHTLANFAVLYRTNAQSRVMEEAFLHAGIPYLLIGGQRFYERKEIKDLLGYMKLLVNPKDEVSRKRAEKLGKGRLANFLQFSQNFGEENKISFTTTLEILDKILGATAYLTMFDPHDPEEAQRLENIKELRSVAQEFPEINQFLENITLTEKASRSRNSDGKNAVSLMTLHSAKGLEFPVVFMIGMEEGLFPHSRSLFDKNELEEERRLCYVGITRAREKLYMSYAVRRLYFGLRSENMISRFIGEIPEEFINFSRSASSWDEDREEYRRKRANSGRRATTDDDSESSLSQNQDFDLPF